MSGAVSETLDELRRSLQGTVVEPGDAEYDSARRCFNALTDRRPAVIVRVASPADVASAFDFARTQGLEVAVRGGGHNPAGHCVADDALVIDLSPMRGIAVDTDAKIARSAGGATWLDFDSATQAYGLATPGGVVGSTGVAGLTLGGGIGHLTAQHGLTCDNLIGAELVTPRGSVVRASEDENPELLWGLRGGGGNFGVAAELVYRLYEVERVVGGMLEYRGGGSRDALRVFRDVVAGSPRDLGCQTEIGVDGGTPVVSVFPCYTGSADDPDALRALRSAPGLVHDDVGERSFLDQQRIFDSPYGENRHYWKGHFVSDLTDELLDELRDRVTGIGGRSHVLIESLHGGPKDYDTRDSPISYREAGFNVSVMAVWSDPILDVDHIEWARSTAAAIEPWSFGGGYANYMQADEPLERVRGAFGAEAFERLRALKTKYDPENVLHRNQNIPPL
jgi:FAD/FMN-containing dehydrogenase